MKRNGRFWIPDETPGRRACRTRLDQSPQVQACGPIEAVSARAMRNYGVGEARTTDRCPTPCIEGQGAKMDDKEKATENVSMIKPVELPMRCRHALERSWRDEGDDSDMLGGAVDIGPMATLRRVRDLATRYGYGLRGLDGPDDTPVVWVD